MKEENLTTNSICKLLMADTYHISEFEKVHMLITTYL